MRFPVISVTTVVLSDREFEVKTVLLLVFLIVTILVEYSIVIDGHRSLEICGFKVKASLGPQYIYSACYNLNQPL